MKSSLANCPCDRWVHPELLEIAAGLDNLPRQIGTFAEFRRAMVAALKDKPALAKWHPGGEDDLGTMLLEMWAYVCDSLAFYDQVIAHEAYLRTAQQRPSLRKLTGLLGYVPRPAVAASVKLAIIAEGRQLLTLPPGTAFRSGSFDGEPPQVFELDRATKVHPFFNQLTLKRPRPKTLGSTEKTLLLKYGTANLKRGDLVLIRVQGNTKYNQVRIVSNLTVVESEDRERYHQVEFETGLNLPDTISPTEIHLAVPTQQTSLSLKSFTSPKEPGSGKPSGKTTSGSSGTSSPTSSEEVFGKESDFATQMPSTLISKEVEAIALTKQILQNTVVLNGYYPQIKPNHFIILALSNEYYWSRVKSNDDETVEVTDGKLVKVKNSSDNSITVAVPPVFGLATKLTLEREKFTKVTNKNYREVVVHYDFVDGGIVTVKPKNELNASDEPFTIADSLEQPTENNYSSPSSFVLQDKNEVGIEVSGSLVFATYKLDLNSGTKTWSSPLQAPVSVYGNLIGATRGETVKSEILGSGDASQTNQSFTLKKKPLTYLAAPTTDNDRGVVSTLQIYVNDILWQEVPNFYKVQSDAEVYIVRQNDEGESIITFGDGKRGARLPTGTNNVVANYRYGAGAATPPAGSINQLAKPVKGLTSIRNPLAAFGGGDAESTKDLRKHAPNSALIMGRAVSIQDMEALAASVPGVRAVQVEWHWHESQQQTVVQVYYIGKSGIESTIAQKLRALSDSTIPFAVTVAQPQKVSLTIEIEMDDRYLDSKIFEAVETKLLGKGTGLLAPEQVGIGRPFYRSHLFAAVAAVPGVLAVSGVLWNGQPFAVYALSPEPGKYFDFENQNKNWLSKKEFNPKKGGNHG